MTRSERQQLAIEKWKEAKCKASIVCPTGFGKTRTALDAIERVLTKNPSIKVVVVVPTKILKDQWEDEIEKRQFDADVKVYIINTASSNSFYCDFLIIDEIHRSNSVRFRQIFNNCNPSFILGLTATYERLDSLEKEVVDKICPICDEVTIEEAQENGWIAPYTEYKVCIDVDLTEYEKANQEFLKYFSMFGYDFNLAMSCLTNIFQQQQLAKQMNCTLKDVKSAVYSWNRALKARKDFVLNHPIKLEIAKKIIAARPTSKIITFNGSIKQCEAYKIGYVLHSGETKKKNRMTLEEFSHCKDGVLHTSKMADEGLDVKGLNVAIITGFNSSKISKRQRIGRCVRFEPGKNAEIFTLVLKGTVEDKWYSKSMEGLDYIEINEQELEQILNHEKLINKQKIKQTIFKNDLLRF